MAFTKVKNIGLAIVALHPRLPYQELINAREGQVETLLEKVLVDLFPDGIPFFKVKLLYPFIKHLINIWVRDNCSVPRTAGAELTIKDLLR